MSRLGSRIAADFLEKGQQYNAKRKTGEATVEIVKVRRKNKQVVQVDAEILKGGFDAGTIKLRTGDMVELPADTDFFEMSI